MHVLTLLAALEGVEALPEGEVANDVRSHERELERKLTRHS